MPILADSASSDIITAADLASYLRTTVESGMDFIVRLANGVVREEIGDLADYSTRVQAITLEVAARAWRNPEGFSSETVDDYTYRRDTQTRKAGVYLTAEERAELRSATLAPESTMYVIDLGTPAL